MVAPHPDDEVLGCAAALHRAAATVIHVTDGVPPWTVADAYERVSVCPPGRVRPGVGLPLSSQVELHPLGFGDLVAWQAVEDISDSLCDVIGPSGVTDVFLPAYQRGHPDHDATYLAGAMAREPAGQPAGPLLVGLWPLRLRRGPPPSVWLVAAAGLRASPGPG